ncbi:MAG: putative DNA-binding domain-containing protein [Bacterioplanes sp.]|nr:putative DNA-binding domain-containing protein [Bacterioplanes sp.]
MQQAKPHFYQQFIAYLQGEAETTLAHWLQAKPEDWRRLQVYRNSSMKASVQALADNFPVSGSVLADEQFRQLARDYVFIHRPEHAVLAWYGQQFPDWLQTQLPRHQCPWLSDLARLERCWLNCLLAEDQKAVSAEDISHLANAGTNIEKLKLGLCSSVELLETHFDVWTLWVQQRDDPSYQQQATVALEHNRRALWRQADHTLQYRVLSAAEWHFLQALNTQSCCLHDAVSAALRVDEHFDVSGSFAGLLQHGLLCIR